MNVVLSPSESEFSTHAEATPYDTWFRAQVQASLDDTQPCILHDQALAELDFIIDEARTSLAGLSA
jgi:hypothetical protein